MPWSENRDRAGRNRLQKLRPFLRKLAVAGIGASTLCVGLGFIDLVLGAMGFPTAGPLGTDVGLLLIGFGLLAIPTICIAIDSLEGL